MTKRPLIGALLVLAVATLAACTGSPDPTPAPESTGQHATRPAGTGGPAAVSGHTAAPALTSAAARTTTAPPGIAAPGNSAAQPSPPSPRSQQPEQSGLPAGLYGMAAWRPTTTGNTTLFSTSGSCTAVLDTLAAGQWLTTTLATPSDLPSLVRDLMPWYLVSLTRGSQSAYLKLVEGANDCDGTLVVATDQKVVLAGAEKLDGTGHFTPFQCGPNPFDRESMMLTGFYDADSVHLLVSLTVPAQQGAHDLDAADTVDSVQILRGTGSMLEHFGAAFASQALTDGDQSEAVPGATAFRATDKTRAHVTTTSLYPLDGTMQLSGLRGESGPPLDLTAGFHCDTAPLPPPSVSDEEAGDQPSVPLDGDAPASTDGEGSVTVTVASGPRKGTYRGTGSLKCNHHRFGPDSWWVLFSSASEDPSAVTLLNLWSQPKDKIGKTSAYDEPYLLDIGFGAFVLDKDLQIHVNADVGGAGGKVAVKGSTVTATATTAGKVRVTITAECT